jgi:CutA1 divalent ion tolerance protein
MSSPNPPQECSCPPDIRPLGWAGLRRTDHERLGIHGPDPRRIREDHGKADRERKATPPMTELCEVILTAPDPGWLKDLSRKLIEQRLCASAHNFAPVRSIYRWRGEMNTPMRGPASPREPLPMATRIT